MGTWIEKLIDRLLTQLWNLLAAKVTAYMEAEYASTQAELLERAQNCRGEFGELGEALARRLESASERLGMKSIDDPVVLLGTGEAPPLRIKAGNGELSGGAGKRSRGRPKKKADGNGAEEPPHSAEGNGEALPGSLP